MSLQSPQALLKQICLPSALQLGFRAKYKLTIRRHGKIRLETNWSPNMILDQGMAAFGGGVEYTPFRYCHVGTGTSAASAAQTQLDAYLAGTDVTSGSASHSGSPNYIITQTGVYAFAQGAVVGTISEVGVGRQLGNGMLDSRARIVDGGGVPTSISLVSMDQLTVTYALSCVRVLTSGSGSVTLDGISYSYTSHVNSVTSVTPSFGLGNSSSRTGFLTGINGGGNSLGGSKCILYRAGTALSPTVLTDNAVPVNTGSLQYTVSDSAVAATYSSVPSSNAATVTLTVPAVLGNMSGGIQSLVIYFILFGQTWTVLYQFAVPIPKDNTKTLVLALATQWIRL